jgi:hypothetical protein
MYDSRLSTHYDDDTEGFEESRNTPLVVLVHSISWLDVADGRPRLGDAPTES